MNKLLKNQQGQGIIELLIAIFVIIMGVAAILALSISTIIAGQESISRVEASNLAREGVEVVRSIRDSNWLKIEAGELTASDWDDGLYEVRDYDAVAEFYPDNDPDTGALGDGGNWKLDYSDTDYTLYRLRSGDYQGVYVHAGYIHDGYGAGDPSAYTRRIYTYPICSVDHLAVDIGLSCAVGDKIGLKVQSIVEWQERGRTHSVTVEENLYNWKL